MTQGRMERGCWEENLQKSEKKDNRKCDFRASRDPQPRKDVQRYSKDDKICKYVEHSR